MNYENCLFFGKEGDKFCALAEEYLKQVLPDTTFFIGKRGEPFPAKALDWEGNYIISYLAPWIIPKQLLSKAKKASINFHPGPPEYPGIGCTNFAIYNNEEEYGITCHHMEPSVDTGKIIAVRRFPIEKSETVYSLTQKCYSYIHSLFYDISTFIINGRMLPFCQEEWKRKPYTRSQLNDLCRIDYSMSAEEIKKRIHAVDFPGAPGAILELHGFRFNYAGKI